LVSVQLFVVDNCVDDWRIAISIRGALLIAVELVVCSVHPVPGSYHFLWMSHRHQLIHDEGDGDESSNLRVHVAGSRRVMPTEDYDEATPARVPFDVLLSLPMFLRLYLVGRGA